MDVAIVYANFGEVFDLALLQVVHNANYIKPAEILSRLGLCVAFERSAHLRLVVRGSTRCMVLVHHHHRLSLLLL